jgi:hypothetical protein
MKPIALLLFAIILYSCSDKEKRTQLPIPQEYQLPLEEIRKGKTIVYVESTTGDSLMLDAWTITKEGKEHLVYVTYDTASTRDSAIVSVEHDLEELYTWVGRADPNDPPQKYSLKSELIDDGSKYGKEKFKWSLDSDNLKVLFDGTRTYVKDTVLQFAGSSIDCIVIQINSIVEFKTSFDSLNQKRANNITMYYGKGVGEVSRTGQYDTSWSHWQLKEMRPLVKK